MRPIKILSIRQPWAGLIVAGYKDIENRSWHTRYRGPILIHAAQRLADITLVDIRAQFGRGFDGLSFTAHRGGIVGIAEVVDCVDASSSPWFEGPFGFVLRNARPLPFWPMAGRLGLFDPPNDVPARYRNACTIENGKSRIHRS